MNFKKNILFYEPSSGFGGSANSLMNLVKHLDREEFHSIVVVKNIGSQIKKIKNVRIIKLRDYNEQKKISILKYVIFFLKNIIPEIFQISFILKQNKINLVHVNTNINSGIPAIMAAKIVGIPVVCWIRETRELVRREKFFQRFVKHFVVLNRDAYQLYKSVVTEEKISIIYNRVDINDFSNVPLGDFKEKYELKDSFIAGLVLRIVKGKGLEQIIAAAERIVEYRKAIKFIIVGDAKGGDEDYLIKLKDLVKSKNLEKSIIFTGWIDDVKSAIANFDVLIHPSTSFPEGLPRIILEAMVMQKPVIATDICGSREIVKDGENGFLVSVNDLNALCERIIYFFKNKEEKVRMGKQGIETIKQKFEIRKITKNCEDIYAGILNRTENKEKEINLINLHAATINIGDEALTSATHEAFRSAINGVVKFYDISTVKHESVFDHIEDFIPLQEYYKPRYFIKLIKFMHRADAIICGGGDLIVGFIPYLGVMGMGKILGIPTIFYSIGANMRSASRIQRAYTKLIIKMMDVFIVREEGSIEELTSLGVKPQKIITSADIALTLKQKNKSEFKKILSSENINGDKKLVSVSVRGPEEQMFRWGDEEYQSLAEALDYLVEKYDVNMLFIPMLNKKNRIVSTSNPESSFLSDEDVSDLIIEKMQLKKNAFVLRNEYNVFQIMEVCGEMEFLLGMRLHSFILSFNTSTPFIALNYAPKVRRFMELIGQNNLCMDLEDLKSNKLKEKIDYIWRQKKQIQSLLQEKHEILKRNAMINVDVILSFLGRKKIGNFYVFLMPAVVFLYFFHYPIYLFSEDKFRIVKFFRRFSFFSVKKIISSIFKKKKVHDCLLKTSVTSKEKNDIVNILYFEPSSGFGGSSTALVNLLQCLDKTRFCPRVLTFNKGVNFVKIKMMNIYLKRFRYISFKQVGRGNGYFISICEFLLNILPFTLYFWLEIWKNNIRLIHVNTNILMGFPVIILARVFRIPVVCHLRETRDLIKREKMLINYVEKFISINKKAYEIYKKYIPEKKLLMLHDGVNLERFDDVLFGDFRAKFNLNGFRVVGLVGRIVEGKGHREFILAAKEVLKTRSDIKVVIVGDVKGGDDEYCKNIKKLVKKENLQEEIIFTNWQSNIFEVINNFEILVQATTTFPEGFGLTIIEAMALKKPVIATNIPGPSDIVVDGENGFLVPPGDVKELSKKINFLLDNTSVSKRMGEKGRIVVKEKFDITKKVKIIEQIYENCLRKV